MQSNFAAYEWPLSGTVQVVYSTSDNHIHEMSTGQERRWRDEDITPIAGGPTLETPILAAYVWPDGRTKQIAYTSPMSNGHIHELVLLQDHSWTYEDIMEQPKAAPPSDGTALAGYGSKASGSKYVVYTAADGHIHELAAGLVGSWRYTNLTQTAQADPAEGRILTGYAWDAQKTRQVVDIAADGHVHELMVGADGCWSHRDLTALADAPLAQNTVLVGYV